STPVSDEATGSSDLVGVETRPVAIVLASGSPGIQVVYRPLDGFATAGEAADILGTTDSTGRASWKDRPVGEKYKVIDKVKGKTIFGGTVNEDPNSNTQLVAGDRTADDLVRIRMSATHHTTNKQLRNFTFALRNVNTGWITYISTGNDVDAPYAEPLLE